MIARAGLPRVLAVNDLSCLGKCSLSVALPILSGCGAEAVSLPTVLLSTHTGGFTGYTRTDLTADYNAILAHFEALEVSFDAVYTGYFSGEEQIDRLLAFLQKCPDTLKVIDPVMADNGRLYAGFDESYLPAMRRLLAQADVATPNLTEACLLCGLPYRERITAQEAEDLLARLREFGVKDPVITGVRTKEGGIGYVFSEHGETAFLQYKEEHRLLHGCGDVFASALTGFLLGQKSFADAVRLAAEFTRLCITKTLDAGCTDPYGLNFEPLLPLLR